MNTPGNPDKDRIYAQPLAQVADFQFDEKVAAVFADMINRSVPGYETLIQLIGSISARFTEPGTCVYDLGCSLGAGTLAILHHNHHKSLHFVAVDNSEAMLTRCRQNLEHAQALAKEQTLEFRCEDICHSKVDNASLVLLNFTLQFVALEQRLSLLQKIHTGLNDGGALLLSEKILSTNTEQQTLVEQLHMDFKKANGYSELEISQKRSALENVLIAETVAQHRDRLQQAGFRQVIPWFQCFNFVSLLCLK